MKTALPLAEARTLAAAIVADLAPVCERVEIAGSLRRERPDVGDVELVAVPRFEPAGLFGTEQQNALWAYLTSAPASTFTKGDKPDGRYFQVQHQGVQVDIFTAEASNFGWQLLIRTGPALFSQSVLVEWKRQKCLGKDQQGSKDGYLVDRYGRRFETPEERDVFGLLGLPVIAPRERTDDVLARVRARR